MDEKPENGKTKYGEGMNKLVLIILRIVAYLIDCVILIFLLLIFGRGSIFIYFSCFVLFAFYRYLMTALWGYTLGMRLVGLTLQNYSLKNCFIRELSRIGSGFYYIGYIYGSLDSNARAFHDIISGTVVYYKNRTVKDYKISIHPVFYILTYTLLVLSVLKWSSSFLLNDVGGLGLSKKFVSSEFHQSFSGDRLISLNQQQLYMNTLGRHYTTVTTYNKKLFLTRIANKLTYTDVYRLIPEKSKLRSCFEYRIKLGLQYITCVSASLMGKIYLCGISPKGQLVIVDENGKIINSLHIKTTRILTLTSGDINGDNKDEIIIMAVDGRIEIIGYENNNIVSLYYKKPIEQISPMAFYVNTEGDIVIIGGENKISHAYSFKYYADGLKLIKKSIIPSNEISYISTTTYGLLTSNINRLNMTLGVGKIQQISMYSAKDNSKLLYNLSIRYGRLYRYKVRNVEGVYDIDGDGEDEIIVKAVKKGDVMGNAYVLEVYGFNSRGRFLNRFFTLVNRILKLNK